MLVAALLQYLAVTLLLTSAVVLIATDSGLMHPRWTELPQIAAYLALGCSMFVSLLLQRLADAPSPLAACAAALLAVLTGYAGFVLGSAARHAARPQ